MGVKETTSQDHWLGLPVLRDPSRGWLHFVPLFYALFANVAGVSLIVGNSKFYLYMLLGVLLLAHGRVLAAYLVHEAAHGNIFKDHVANHWFGVAAMWCAGCPYCDFRHVRIMHIKHHKDRADVVEFDYRAFFGKSNFLVRSLILSLEYCFIPIIETIHHSRCALYPLLYPVPPSRRQSAAIGTPLTVCMYISIYLVSPVSFLMYLVSGILMLNFLALSDAFHHTYKAVMVEDYVPGPGDRTAIYEEENTFSNLVAVDRSLAWLNCFLALNFGYHNAHHLKPMTPWYDLPNFHRTAYGSEGTDQVLPFSDLWDPWWNHRLKRVVDEDYGVVKPAGTPKRAKDFVGALGVSFLTV